MNDSEPITEPSPAGASTRLKAPCRHLRSNGMYIFDGHLGDAQDEEYEPSACWCLHTMKNFGPDDRFVGLHECREPGRSCYEPL
jgi:hypothetical protein